MISLSFVSVSQTIDTVCIPLPKAKEIIAAAEQKKILEKDIITYQSDIQILNDRLAGKDARLAEKDSIITTFKEKDTINQGITKTFQDEIVVLNSEKADYKKALKKQTRKTRFAALVGIAAGIGILFIFK